MPNRNLLAMFTVALALLLSPLAQAKDSYRLAWSIYVGWMPWGYADETGIIDKWASKYGIDIEVVQFNDYIESINQYTAGAFDACSMTNMDALTIPAAGGVDSTALIVGDFSNGNDGIVLKGDAKSLKDLKGQNVNLLELSVSHYVLARALASVGMTERDVRVVNTSDADVVAAFSSSDVTAVATWNPMLEEVKAVPASSMVFDSSMIPGEIIDLMVVNTETLQGDPRLGKALTGAWYETMALMAADSEEGKLARTAMAEASGTDLAGYDLQLAATQMFFEPGPAVEFVRSPVVQETMAQVAQFSFDHGLLGEGAPDSGVVGIAYPSGVVKGASSNVKLRFDDQFMDLAAKGEL